MEKVQKRREKKRKEENLNLVFRMCVRIVYVVGLYRIARGQFQSERKRERERERKKRNDEKLQECDKNSGGMQSTGMEAVNESEIKVDFLGGFQFN